MPIRLRSEMVCWPGLLLHTLPIVWHSNPTSVAGATWTSSSHRSHLPPPPSFDDVQIFTMERRA